MASAIRRAWDALVRPVVTDKGEPREIVKRGYSLLPMDLSRRPLRGAGVTPGDIAMLRSYAESPWLHAKLSRVCTSLAGVGFSVNKRDPKSGSLELLTEDHPLWLLLKNPNPMLTGFDFRFLTFLYARMTGEVYWRLKGTGLGVAELWVYPKHWVRPQYSRDRKTIEFYEIRAALSTASFGEVERVSPRQMVWLRRPDPEDPYAKGVGEALSVATEVDTFELASESDRRFFENDASPPGALIVPGMPTPEERQRIRDDWQNVVGGPEKAGSIPVLAGGMDFKQFRQGRKEMDFIEGQRYLRDVIIAGVHKHILGITEDVNLAAAKAAEHTFARWELRPDILWMQDVVNKSLAPLYDERAFVMWENPVPADEEFELKRSSEGFMRGAIKRNEWRLKNGFEELPDEEGNVYLLPLVIQEVKPGEDRDAGPNPSQARPANSQDRNDSATDRAVEELEGKPFGGYRDFADCVRRNRDKRNPRAYCAEIMHRIEDEKQVEKPAHKALTPAEIRRVLDAVDPQDLAKRLSGAYEQIIEDRVEDARQEVEDRVEDARQEVGADVSFDVAPVLARRYATEQAMERVTNINQHTREALQRELDAGLAEGESIPELSRRINEVFDAAKSDRGELIARTETIAASNWAALESYKEVGVEYKEWLLAPDYSEGEDDGECAEVADAGPILITDDWGGIDYPPLHPNCRCAVAPVFVEREEQVETESVSDVSAKQAPEGYRFKYLYATPEQKQRRITALGRVFTSQERMFLNAFKRAMQAQQNGALKAVRREAAD